ncbi:MAG: hypothetical protein ACYC6R_14125 [Anaerolineales bacterium]
MKFLRYKFLIIIAALVLTPAGVRAQESDWQLIEEVATQAAQSLGWDTYDKWTNSNGDVFNLVHEFMCGEYNYSEYIHIIAYLPDSPSIWINQTTTFHGYPADDDEPNAIFSWLMGRFYLQVFANSCNDYDKMDVAEALYTVAVAHNLGEETPPEPNPDPYIDPDPYVDPNPDPNPDPGPISIDQETLRTLQSILSTPGLPITGAVAGGLVAWVISMLGGGRTVLPTPPRPPTGGLRPGQVGPDGKILSPTGQGWVSKSMYDYQQKWLQKGWRWNSQTGKFEGQHGAVNENGLVQDDELGWVDQQTFNDNEQKRAQGYVYNRSMGWQTPEDSNRYESDRNGRLQRERERSADKNAQIQSELKESQAQRDQAFQQQMQKLDDGRIAEIKANIEMYQKRAQKYVNWDKNLEYATYVAQMVETAADVGVAVCARLTGPAGKAIAAAYETAKEVATTADDVLASDDVVGKAEELGDDKIKDEYKDKIKEKIEEKVTPYIPKFVNRIANQIKRPIKKFILRKTGKTGLIIYQEAEKKLLEYGKEQVEEFVEGQVETAVEEIKNNIDPNLLTGV